MNESDLQKYTYHKKNGKSETTFFKFEIIQYGVLTKIVKLKSFWDILFSLYDFTSIIVSNEKIELIIGVNHVGDNSIKLDLVIAKIKTIAVKNLPNEYELSFSNINISKSWDLMDENIKENSRSKFRKYYAFSSLNIKSKLLQTYISILEIDGIKLIISSEKKKEKNLFSFLLCITQNSIESIMVLEKRLFKFLMLNPIFGGKITVFNKNRYKRKLDLILLGFSDIRILIGNVYPLLDPLDSLIIKNSINNRSDNHYPWLGFLEENNNSSLKPEFLEYNISNDKINELLTFFKNNNFENITYNETSGDFKMKYRKFNVYFSFINRDQIDNLNSCNFQLSQKTLKFHTNTKLFLQDEFFISPFHV